MNGNDHEMKDLREENAKLKLALETANQFRDGWEEKYRKLRKAAKSASGVMGELFWREELNELNVTGPDLLKSCRAHLDTLRSILNEG